eukprot:CAMPEP_0194060486 /NCGR_PEP_ID=MMETSP0009_2-20130614/71890_1 /TAXON_ID=210454 /ORGANISM="Grammatophora oceanica, Strain CCMP 410" /LENGTH=248 /DNA_ID=CAMNT_0038711421 /DNA_START=14 /DNA_END=757 /DNA_ORIENTATION=+
MEPSVAATALRPPTTPTGESPRGGNAPPKRKIWSIDSRRGLTLSLTPNSGGSPTKNVATVDLEKNNFADPLDVHLECDEEASETSELYREQQRASKAQPPSKRFYETSNGKRVYKPPPQTQPNWRFPAHTEDDEDDVTYYTNTELNNASWANNSWAQGSWTGRMWRQSSVSSVVSELSLDKEAISNPAVDLPFDSMAMGKSCRISHKKKDEAYPNHPHPSLECPPLYFVLKMIPGSWLTWIRSLYALR